MGVQNFSKKLKKRGVSIYYEGVDWITLKVPSESRLFAFCKGLSDNSDTFHFRALPFRLVYRGPIASGSFLLYDFTDGREKLGQFKLKVHDEKKRNKNEPTSFSLDGTFFSVYSAFFRPLMDFLGIPSDMPGLILRLDYCVDYAGVSIDEIYRHRKTDKSAFKSSNTPIWTDEGTGEVMAKTLLFDKGEIGIYDKKRDILAKGKEKLVMVDGSRPFFHYVHEPFSIARIETRWTSHSWYRKKDYATIDWAFSSAPSLFRDWVLDYYALDYSDFGTFVRLDRYVPDSPNNRVLSDKLKFNLAMLRAYLRNCHDLLGDVGLFEEINDTVGWIGLKPSLSSDYRDSDFYRMYSKNTIYSPEELFDFFQKSVQSKKGFAE